MNIATVYPYKLLAAGFVSNSGTPVASGDVQYIAKSAGDIGVDNTYIKNNNAANSLRLFFRESQHSSLENSITSATLRTRLLVPNIALTGYIQGSGFDEFNLTGNMDVQAAVLSHNFSPINSVGEVKVQTDFSSSIMSGSTYVDTTGFSTRDISLTVQNPSIDLFKNLVFNLYGIPSGTQISCTEMLLVGDPSNGMTLNTIGQNGRYTSVAYQNANLIGKKSRSWAVDESSTHPTGIFNIYESFAGGNAGEISSCSVGQFYDYGNNSPVSFLPKNIYKNPYFIASGQPNDYQNSVLIYGSGISPSKTALNITDLMFEHNAWTSYFNIKPLTTNYLLFRYGQPDYSFADSYIFKIEITSSGLADTCDRILLKYTDGDGLSGERTRQICETGFYPFSNTNEHTKVVVSYSGSPINGTYKPTGSFYFYVEDKETNKFRYLGTANTWIDNGMMNVSSTRDIGGTSWGNSPSALAYSGLLSEFGHSENVVISGVQTYLSKTVMNDARYEPLLTNKKDYHTFVSSSGDSKYVDIKIPQLVGYSGEVKEYVGFTIPSGGPAAFQHLSPIKSHLGNYWVSPSAVYLDYKADIFTSHPSGVDLVFNVNAQFGGQSGILSFEVNGVPSGVRSGTLTYPNTYGFTSNQPIYWNSSDGSPYFNDLSINAIVKQPAVNSDRTYDTEVKLHYLNPNFSNVVLGSSIPQSATASTTLFLNVMTPDSGLIPLYMIGHSTASGISTLYTIGKIPETAEITLYSNGGNLIDVSGLTTLYSKGSTVGEIFGTTKLYLDAVNAIRRDSELPLFIDGGVGSTGISLNLYLESHYDSTSAQSTLYIAGPTLVQDSGTALYIAGNGITDGTIPLTGAMPLFISRGNEDSTSETVRFYVAGPMPASGSPVSVFIFGAYTAPSSITLFSEGAVERLTGTQKLYTSGF